ncbi:hypothetical protein GO755_10630 [Spirosoma sp. HMF4905]|uniref:DUF3137 domain-containing protein n=1 Tax=Spirosoma arboris TaxID=2682092 RepID=A0A7K1S9K5_9BACT|nr:hypothetical protein [Spirosoma arboris]MVM30489.1 hypothetical protein [Spirosoma arboris]
MDESTLKTTLIALAAGIILLVFVYTSWQSRSRLAQVQAFPSVLQAAGLHLITNPTLHESYRFLPTFYPNMGVDKTLYAATKQEDHTHISALVYEDKRVRSIHPVLVLIATLSYTAPAVGIYTRSTPFGPITPTGQRVFKTNETELDKAFKITAVSEPDFQSLVTPELRQFLGQNKDITHIEMAHHTLALFTSDDRFFALTTLNGIPSPEVFTRRLSQLHELQRLLDRQFHE